MELPHRRRFLNLAAGALALPAISRFTWAQTYPARPVRIIVGFAAGGLTDIIARLIGQQLSDRLGRQFIVENRPGAGTNVATEAVANARPDGYTFLLATSSNAINATLYEKLNFSFVRDLDRVGSIADAPHIMEVNPSFPARTVSDFITYAKANSGKINFASAGIGSSSHVTGELFKMMAGVNMTHVPYRGSSPAITDVIGGQVQVTFDPIASSIEYIRAGKLRALAGTGKRRLDVLPDIPIMSDFLPGFEASAWQGLCAPKNTPPAIILRLNNEINAALGNQKFKAQLQDLGLTGLPGSPADFGKLITEDTNKWANVIKFVGIKAD